jgi:hypothetical protein
LKVLTFDELWFAYPDEEDPFVDPKTGSRGAPASSTSPGTGPEILTVMDRQQAIILICGTRTRLVRPGSQAV